MIVQVEIKSYNLRSVDEPTWDRFTKAFPDEVKEAKDKWWGEIKCAMPLDDLFSIGLPADCYQITPIKRLIMSDDKFQHFKRAKTIEEFEGAMNTIHVHLPGFDVMTIRQIIHIDNACTDEIQTHLKDGWKILAILPQPNHRRPDYILGLEISK